MAGLGAALAVYNVVTNNRDVSLAIGSPGTAQEQFFVDAAERPDIAVFFKNLKPSQRLKMSQNIGRYDDPQLAKLIGKCLGSFDADARAALTQSLAHVARVHPKEVAEQLALPGSFQQLAVSSALKEAGPDALPMVAERLTNGDARPNAVAYLVAAGKASVPSLMAMLGHKDKDVRVAAADALGKLRAREAVPAIVNLYQSSTGDEKNGYLASIAGIGDPSTEPLLEAVIKSGSTAIPQRAQAALGLGRIGSSTAIKLLWTFVEDDHQQLRQSAVTALQIGGDRSLANTSAPKERLLEVAEGIHTPAADQVLRSALANPGERLFAARASTSREPIVPSLIVALEAVNADTEGDIADAIIQALVSTPRGVAALQKLNDPALAGLVSRRLELRRLTS